MSTDVIRNSDIITRKINECLNLIKNNESIADSSEIRLTLETYLSQDYLSLEAVRFIKEFWNKNSNSDKTLYIHELLENNNLYLPKYEAPKKSPDYELKMQRLRAQLDEEEYQKMVSNVDLNSPYRDDSRSSKARFVPEFKTVQGQIVSIFNVVLVVGGAFAFGYKAVEYSLDQPDIIKQVFGGLILALIVAAADLYFLIKKLFELDHPKKSSKKPNISISSIKQEFGSFGSSSSNEPNNGEINKKTKREKKND